MKQDFLKAKEELRTRCHRGDLSAAARILGKDVASISQWFKRDNLSRQDVENMRALKQVIAERERDLIAVMHS